MRHRFEVIICRADIEFGQLTMTCTFTLAVGAIHRFPDSMFVTDGVLKEQDWDNVEIEALLVRARSRPVEGQDRHKKPRSS